MQRFLLPLALLALGGVVSSESWIPQAEAKDQKYVATAVFIEDYLLIRGVPGDKFRQQIRRWQQETGIPLSIRKNGNHWVLWIDSSAGEDIKGRLKRLGQEASLRLEAYKPPRIDGLLSEDVWQLAPAITHFTQREPQEGQPATERTEVRILYDRNNLYLGIMCYDSEPRRIIATEMRRDARLRDNDSFEILLDTYLDRRNAFYFATNPRGVRRDALITDEGKDINDDWDCIWEVKARIGPQGWSAEIALPFHQLRFPKQKELVWGVNFGRRIRRKREEVYWVPVPRDFGFRGFMRVSNAGLLTGLRGLQVSRHVEVKPYNLGGWQQDLTQMPILRKTPLKAGLDIKVSLATNLTLDVTYRTDFAQVESDPERVNLTRFSLYYPEKRDFFLEGAGVFQFGLRKFRFRGPPDNQLFYSRRIGLHNGEEVPILGGIKLTGKTGAYTLGLIGMVTQPVDDIPRTAFAVLRIKRDILQRSGVGMLFTGKQSLETGSYNRALGFDLSLSPSPWAKLNGYAAQTWTPGLSGQNRAFGLNFRYQTDRWNTTFSLEDIGDNFNPEMGFYRRVGIRKWQWDFDWSPRPRWEVIRQIFVGPEVTYITNQQSILETRVLRLGGALILERGGFLHVGIEQTYDRLFSPFNIYGDIKIPMGVHTFSYVNLGFNSDRSKPLAGSLRFEGGQFYTGHKQSYRLEGVVRPTAHFRWDILYDFNRVMLPQGNFRTHVMSTRLTYSLTTELYAKLYLQWNDSRQLISSNFLLHYIFRPGSDFYLVYNQSWRTEAHTLQTQNWTLLAKITYLWNF